MDDNKNTMTQDEPIPRPAHFKVFIYARLVPLGETLGEEKCVGLYCFIRVTFQFRRVLALNAQQTCCRNALG
jgi:hypothetical protein